MLFSTQLYAYQCETSAYNPKPSSNEMLRGSSETKDLSSWEACYQYALSRAHNKPTAYENGRPVLLKYFWKYNDSYVVDSSGIVSSLTDKLYSHPSTGDRYVSEFELFQAGLRDDFK